MTKRLNGVGICTLAIVLVGCAGAHKAAQTEVAMRRAATAETAEPPRAAETAEPPSGTVAQNMVYVRATVVAVDQKKRLVTLRKADGGTDTIAVDEQVRNLPQVKKGDQVVVTYYEAVAYAVRRPGEATPGVTVAEGVARAKKGEKPAGVGVREVTVTATIEAIDKKKPSVTLKGPGGKVVTVVPRDPKNLERVAVGDLVDITYTEELAIAVEKAPKR
jgi:hypothetical protein